MADGEMVLEIGLGLKIGCLRGDLQGCSTNLDQEWMNCMDSKVENTNPVWGKRWSREKNGGSAVGKRRNSDCHCDAFGLELLFSNFAAWLRTLIRSNE